MGTPNILYLASQRRLHWLVAVLVGLQYPAQGWLRAAHDASQQATAVTAGQFFLITGHTLIGLGIGAAVVARLALRRRHPVVPGAVHHRLWWRRLLVWHHRALYAVLLMMVVSGALQYYQGWPIAGRWHEIGKWLLAGMVSLHMAGALWHRFRPADGVWQRMSG